MTRKKAKFAYGEEVMVRLGVGDVRGTVREVYGSPPREHVVVLLTPEISGPYLFEEPTTVSMPIDMVKKVEPVP